MLSLLKSKLLINKLQKLSTICVINMRNVSITNNNYNNSTVSEEELNKFRSFDENNWWTGREFEALRAMNQLRVPFIRDAFEVLTNSSKPLNGIKLLDIGCGAGILSEPLARLGANVTAIDPIQNNINIAINHSINDKQLSHKIVYECVTIEELSQRSENIESFDGVIASEVIEHIDNIELFLTSSLKCLKSGGKLFVTTINQTPISLITAILLAENVFKLLPKGTHEYNKFVGPQALTLLLRECKSQFMSLLTLISKS